MNRSHTLTIILALTALFASYCTQNKAGVKSMSAEEFAPLYDTGAITIDVRTQEEYDSGHVFQTTQIDFLRSDFSEIVSVLERDKTYYLYCRSGNRAGQAGERMLELGFTSVYNIGGFEDLKTAGVPVRPE